MITINPIINRSTHGLLGVSSNPNQPNPHLIVSMDEYGVQRTIGMGDKLGQLLGVRTLGTAPNREFPLFYNINVKDGVASTIYKKEGQFYFSALLVAFQDRNDSLAVALIEGLKNNNTLRPGQKTNSIPDYSWRDTLLKHARENGCPRAYAALKDLMPNSNDIDEESAQEFTKAQAKSSMTVGNYLAWVTIILPILFGIYWAYCKITDKTYRYGTEQVRLYNEQMVTTQRTVYTTLGHDQDPMTALPSLLKA